MDAHRRAELRSIALHRAVADAIGADPSVVDRARERLEEWRARGTVHPHYVDAWSRRLAEPSEVLRGFLVEDSEVARDLRQVSPFAGALDARERWRIWRGVGARS